MPPTLAAHTAWNADFSRHPWRESAAEPHHATHPHSPHGLERRLQSAPAARERRGLHHATHPRSPHGLERRLQSAPVARERRGTPPCHPPSQPTRLGRRLQSAPAARERRGTEPCHPPSQPTRLGTPTSAGTRGPRAPRNRTMPPTLAAHTPWNADFSRHPWRESAAELHHATHPRSPHDLERRLQSAPAARERRGTEPCHPPSQPTRLGTPTSAGTRGARAPRN